MECHFFTVTSILKMQMFQLNFLTFFLTTYYSNRNTERKHTVRRKRNDKRDWCKGKTWLWSVCTKRINMILTKWKEVDIKRGQIALCKDRCGRPWSSTRAYKVKRRGRRKKKRQSRDSHQVEFLHHLWLCCPLQWCGTLAHLCQWIQNALWLR